MKHRFFAILAASVILIGCGPAPARTITVQGVGRIQVVPNQVEMTVKVEFVKDRLNDAMLETQKVMKGFLDLCRRYGLAEADIKTGSIVSDKAYRYVRDAETFIGYRSTQTTSILLRKMDQFETFTRDLMELRIAGLQNIRFGHTDVNRYLSEADLLAVDDANAAADKIIARIHGRKGQAIYINNTDENIRAYDLDSRSQTFNKGLADARIILSPGIMEIQKRVVIMFEIE